MSEKHAFIAVIEPAHGGGAYVTVPFDVEAAFGKKRVPVLATIEGIAYRGTLVRYGTPGHIFPLLKEIRTALGKDIGDVVEITVEEDTAPRTIDVPADLAAALASAGVTGTFSALSFSRRREYVQWVEAAKRAETRQRRIVAVVAKTRV